MNPIQFSVNKSISLHANLTKILSASALSLFLIYCGKLWYSYRFFKKRGLKTPPYEFFFGNFREIRKDKVN